MPCPRISIIRSGRSSSPSTPERDIWAWLLGEFQDRWQTVVCEIMAEEPRTPAGMIIQARTALFDWNKTDAMKYSDDDHGEQLALSVLAFFGAEPRLPFDWK
jgi:hypothetical protein